MTTDDDAMSELKVGRYWSKDEKRQHLENAKDSKRRREIEKFRLQLSVAEKPTIIALSQQKQMRINAKKIDEFATVQEILMNKTRASVEQKFKMNGAPNVTTV